MDIGRLDSRTLQIFGKILFMIPRCSSIDNCLTRESENEEKLTVSYAVGCSLLCLTGVKCHFLFILLLSWQAVVNGTSLGGHE